MPGNSTDLSAQDAGQPVTRQGPERPGTGTVGPRREGLPPLVVELLKMLLLGAAYWGAAELSLRVALVERNVTPVWPPTGIALVAFLLLGPRMWPAILAAAFLVNAPISDSVVEALAIAAGNTL